jgi:hypothetical protein
MRGKNYVVSGGNGPMTDTMLDELETRPEVKPTSHQLLQETAPLVFIHSAPRASSTWFWSKFRELRSTQCYYEPFTFGHEWLTPEKANMAWRRFVGFPPCAHQPSHGDVQVKGVVLG